MEYSKFDAVLAELSGDYKIYAPVRKRDKIRYGETRTVSEIVVDEKSDFSPKEVFYPIVQTMMYFTENDCTESEAEAEAEAEDKKIILLARPCDINGIRRLDKIFLDNGNAPDLYYSRMREKLKIFMFECTEGWENCFCASMGTNVCEDYSVALRFRQGEVSASVRDEVFDRYFENEFTPEFIRENIKKVTLPEIEDANSVHGLGMWKEFDDKCLCCGGCNTVCISCSCFDTADIIYNETSRDGERRRIWASCMQESFTTVAGGHRVRSLPSERMRFKTLHKVYGFNERFGIGHMCVGCGRCEAQCPADISFSDIIKSLSSEVDHD